MKAIIGFIAGVALSAAVGYAAQYESQAELRRQFLKTLEPLSHSPALRREIIATFDHGVAVGRLGGLLECQEIVTPKRDRF